MAVMAMEHCLEVTGIRMRTSKLKLNLDKRELLLVQKSTMQIADYLPALNRVAVHWSTAWGSSWICNYSRMPQFWL